MKKLLVFILDRNSIQGNFLKYHLSASGFNNVILFNTHEDCIYSIHKNIIPDFIIADPDIKNITDLEFLNLIKNNNPSIKVIFSSNNEDISHISALLEAGATDYIVRVGSNQNWIHELISNLHYLIKEELRFK
jgi:DNA-binding NarL/FixJ family response regulator